MADCKVELSSPTIPLLTNCFGNAEYVLIGNAEGGWGEGKYAKRNLIDIISCTLPFRITSVNFESNGTDFLSNIFQNYQAEIFYNNINRYINMSDDEWEYIYDIDDNIIGIRITAGGFDSRGDNKDLIVYLKKKYSVPILAATVITNETDTTADGVSSVYFNGNGTVSDKGFCWSENPNPKISDNYVSVGDGIGAIVGTLTGLTANTTYYVRSYATNEYGTGYGAFTTFTTGDAPPTSDYLLINDTDSLLINSTDKFIL